MTQRSVQRMVTQLTSTAAVLTLATTLGLAQQKPQKQVKNQGEFTIYDAVGKEQDPAKRLSLLNQWTAAYPDTEFQEQRNLHYLGAYSAMETKAVAAGAPDDSVSAGEQAARTVVEKQDALFAANLKPEKVTAADWATAKLETVKQAHGILAAITMTRGDYAQSEAECRKVLEMDPTGALTFVYLSRAIAAQKNMDRYPLVIYYMAHALGMNGPGALAAEQRPPIENSLADAYKFYHGEAAGLDEVKHAAALSAVPPAGWTIKTVVQLAQEREAADAQFAIEHPEVIVWRGIKAKLMEPDAVAFFTSEMKDKNLPDLKGKVISQNGTKGLTVAIDYLDSAKTPTAEATLRFMSPLKEKIEPGTMLTFTGAVVESFDQNPYMVTVSVERKNVQFAATPR